MAIIPAVPGLEVRVKVEDKHTTEYVYDDDDVQPLGNHALVYIESRPLAHFSIHFHISGALTSVYNCHVGAHVYIDGSLTNRRTFPIHTFARPGGYEEEIHSAEDFDKDGYQVLRAFRFAKADIGAIILTVSLFSNTCIVEDEDNMLDISERLIEDLRGLGEIKVDLFRKEKVSYDQGPYGRGRYDHKMNRRMESRLARLENIEQIPEKALKGRALSLRAA
jgi:hypothetical protein